MMHHRNSKMRKTVALLQSYPSRISSFLIPLLALLSLVSSRTINNCSTVSEQIVGPYWVSEDIHKADLRSDLPHGVPLNLTFRVIDAATSLHDGQCVALAGARIDLWQCRYDGLYSDEAVQRTLGENWLRGYQITNESGYAQFYTIFPGWYKRRTVHLHLRVRLYNENATVSYDATTQLYFDDALTDTIFEEVYPYNARGARDMHNSGDHFFTKNNIIDLSGSHKEASGYSSSVDLSVPFLPRTRLEEGGLMGSHAHHRGIVA